MIQIRLNIDLEVRKGSLSICYNLIFEKKSKKKSFYNYMKNQIKVQEIIISISKIEQEDFISLTDMAKYKNAKQTGKVIQQWFRNSKTIEFLGFWKKINNQNFNIPEFEYIKNQAGSNNFSLSVKEWIIKTNAIGIVSKAGRYSGTYAQKDIAFEFATWLSP